MLAGQAGAISLLSTRVAQMTGVDKSEFVDLYRKTANDLPPTTRNRDVVAMALNQIARGIESPVAGDQDIKDEVLNLLH